MQIDIINSANIINTDNIIKYKPKIIKLLPDTSGSDNSLTNSIDLSSLSATNIPKIKPKIIKKSYVNKYLMHDGSIKSADKLVPGDKLMGTDGNPQIILKIDKIISDIIHINPLNSTEFYVLPSDMLVLCATGITEIYSKTKTQAAGRYLTSTMGIRSRTADISYHDNDMEKAKEKVRQILNTECKTLSIYMKCGDICETKVETFMNWSLDSRTCYKIPVQGISFPSRHVDIEPYAIGYWLGDGTSSKSEITTADPEIIEYFRNYTKKIGLCLHERPDIYKYGISSGIAYGKLRRNCFLNALNDYDLLNNKHIPEDYMFNSEQARLELLAGIIDSDGALDKAGYDVCFKSKKLAEDAVFLARSLGFAVHKGARLTERTCTNGANGPVTGNYYRFYICGKDTYKIPCIIARKKLNLGDRKTKKTATISGFTATNIGSHEFYKIELESPSRVFLQDMTVVKL